MGLDIMVIAWDYKEIKIAVLQRDVSGYGLASPAICGKAQISGLSSLFGQVPAEDDTWNHCMMSFHLPTSPSILVVYIIEINSTSTAESMINCAVGRRFLRDHLNRATNQIFMLRENP
jgi:hypothetical protein